MDKLQELFISYGQHDEFLVLGLAMLIGGIILIWKGK